MADYEKKDMGLESKDGLATDKTSNQSGEDGDRKKNLSFSFDKLLSSLNMNRKKKDDTGIASQLFEKDLNINYTAEDDDELLEEDLAISSSQKSDEENPAEIEEEMNLKLDVSDVEEHPYLEDDDDYDDLDDLDLEEDPLEDDDDIYMEPLTEEEEENIILGDEFEGLEEAPISAEEERAETDEVEVAPIEEAAVPEEVLESEEVDEAPEALEQEASQEPAVEESPIVEEEEEVHFEEIEMNPYTISQTEDGNIDYDKVVGDTKLMTIDSIYSCKNLPKNMNESVFMIELYSKTLPENLPIEVKRQSVLNILKVGSLDVENLLQDAYNRIDLLNEVMEDVAQKTEEMNETNIEEIAELNRQIEALKDRMAKRAKYQQKQNTSIGYEIQRIINIVEFINPR